MRCRWVDFAIFQPNATQVGLKIHPKCIFIKKKENTDAHPPKYANIHRNISVLVVQERSGLFRGTGVWKFPTGVVDEGEDICDAAVREVKEETGIDAKFVEILAFRQSHKSFFDKSDLFFVCMLQPLSFNIRIQEQEIEAAQWIPYEEYASQPFIQKHELLKYFANICSAKIQGKYSGFSAVSTITGFSKKESYLYLNKKSHDD